MLTEELQHVGLCNLFCRDVAQMIDVAVHTDRCRACEETRLFFAQRRVGVFLEEREGASEGHMDVVSTKRSYSAFVPCATLKLLCFFACVLGPSHIKPRTSISSSFFNRSRNVLASSMSLYSRKVLETSAPSRYTRYQMSRKSNLQIVSGSLSVVKCCASVIATFSRHSSNRVRFACVL